MGAVQQVESTVTEGPTEPHGLNTTLHPSCYCTPFKKLDSNNYTVSYSNNI